MVVELCKTLLKDLTRCSRLEDMCDFDQYRSNFSEDLYKLAQSVFYMQQKVSLYQNFYHKMIANFKEMKFFAGRYSTRRQEIGDSRANYANTRELQIRKKRKRIKLISIQTVRLLCKTFSQLFSQFFVTINFIVLIISYTKFRKYLKRLLFHIQILKYRKIYERVLINYAVSRLQKSTLSSVVLNHFIQLNLVA